MREPRLVLKPGRNGTIADLVRVAEFVELEQFGRQRIAACVSLTLVSIYTYSSLPDMHPLVAVRAYQ